MKRACPHCAINITESADRPKVIRIGTYRRSSDCRDVQRFRCLGCRKYFSAATTHACVRQKKRQVNYRLWRNLCSGMSLRRVAREMKLSRTTVARKLVYLGQWAADLLEKMNADRSLCEIMEFDDLETFEHTKCKPLSVTLAVEHKSRWILGFEVSQMAAKGRLVPLARKKYGPRKDERKQGRRLLFTRLQTLVKANVHIKSDENPHYAPDVRKHFPNATYEQFKGQRGSIVGQGELKKIRFDPLFSLNHTCAMLRANINRLFRRTWCTTKLPENLTAHIYMYAVYHNLILLERLRPAG